MPVVLTIGQDDYFAVIDEQSASTWNGSLVRHKLSIADQIMHGFYDSSCGLAYLCLPALWIWWFGYSEFNDANFHNAGVLALTFGYGKRTLHFNNDVLIEQTDSGSIRAHNTVPVTIGGHSGGANGANFYLSEFLIYNEVVAGLDRQIMEGYLAHKWGLASTFQLGTSIKRVLRPE